MINSLKSRITKLEEENKTKDETIVELQEKNTILETRINQVDQYVKRMNLRIYGVEVKVDRKGKPVAEKEEEVMKIVQECHKEVGVDLKENSILRAHRIGKPTKLATGKTVQPIIVRFKDWRSRCALYRARPTMSKPIEKKSFKTIGQDVTKFNLDLLDKAKDFVKNDPGANYACADINCNLVVNMKNGTFHHFSSVSDLNRIFKKTG